MLAAMFVAPALGASGPTRLSDAVVSDRTGTTASTITFTVAYRNREGSPANWVRVKIGSVTQTMTKVSGTDWKREVRFRWSGTLAAGQHSVLFQAMSRDRFDDALAGGTVTITVPPTPTPKPTPKPSTDPEPPTPRPARRSRRLPLRRAPHNRTRPNRRDRGPRPRRGRPRRRTLMAVPVRVRGSHPTRMRQKPARRASPSSALMAAQVAPAALIPAALEGLAVLADPEARMARLGTAALAG